jgi:hypothetical protein
VWPRGRRRGGGLRSSGAAITRSALLLLAVCGKHALGGVAVALVLAALFEGVVDGDGPIAQVLVVHSVDGSIRGFEAVEAHKAEPLRLASVGVAHDFGRADDETEGTEGVVKQFLVHAWVEIANEEVGADISLAAVGGGFVHLERFVEELYHVGHLHGILGIALRRKLHEAIPLVRAAHAVFGHVHVQNGPKL